MTLTEFLLARVAEDEEIAADLSRDEPSDSWRVNYPGGLWDCEEFYHIATSKKRVFAECAAKRTIMELHQGSLTTLLLGETGCMACGDVIDTDWVSEVTDRWVIWPCQTIRALGAVYADHPDYREEWRP